MALHENYNCYNYNYTFHAFTYEFIIHNLRACLTFYKKLVSQAHPLTSTHSLGTPLHSGKIEN